MTRWFPVFTAAALVWVYVRFLGDALADAGPKASGPGKALLSTLAAWASMCIVGGAGLSLVMSAGAGSIAVGLVLVAVAVLLLAPWPIATLIAIPMGWAKVAYGLARLSTLRSHPDPVGVAMSAATRALLRAPERRPADERWVERHGHGSALTSGMVLAHGLLATLRGDDALARRLLAAVEQFDPASHDDMTLRWAREWRALEAAERGAWAEVVDITDKLGPMSPATRWLHGVGHRFTGSPEAPDEDVLDARWRRVPNHNAVSDLHHACLAHRPQPLPDPVEVHTGPLQAHVDALAHPTPARLAASLAAWAAVANDPTRRPMLPRALDDLASAAGEVGLPMPPLPPGLTGLAPRTDVDDEVLRPLELAASHLTDRLASPTPIDPLAALLDWMEIAARLDDVRRRGSPGALRLAFRPAYMPLMTLSVTLYNDLEQPLLSNALSRWLLALAKEVGDARAVVDQTRNLAATS